MTQLLLVRHGQASFGGNNYDVLSAKGAQQTALTGEHLRRIGSQFDAVYTGRMARQQDSARHAAFSDYTVDPAFDEYDFEGILRAYLPVVVRNNPGLSLSRDQLFGDPRAFQAVFELAIGYWLAGSDGDQPVESWQHFKARVLAGLQGIAQAERKTVAVFTSGGVIAVAAQAALGLSNEMTFKLNWRIANASLHRFKQGRSGLSLIGFNDIAHLQAAGDAALLSFR